MKKYIVLVSLLFSTIMPVFVPIQKSNIFDAVESKNLSRVKYFVKKGVNLNALNKDGKTVLDVATERQHNKICRYLLRCGAKVTNMDNVRMLEHNLKRRGALMTIFGVLSGFTLIGIGLLIGGILSFSDRSLICVL